MKSKLSVCFPAAVSRNKMNGFLCAKFFGQIMQKGQKLLVNVVNYICAVITKKAAKCLQSIRIKLPICPKNAFLKGFACVNVVQA